MTSPGGSPNYSSGAHAAPSATGSVSALPLTDWMTSPGTMPGGRGTSSAETVRRTVAGPAAGTGAAGAAAPP